ncbi:MAG: ImmA/IrrE family metallo-endopeptidase [Solirubrobacteraceae bacterium]
MQHGFKAQAERLALLERKDLGLTDRCRLNPVDLAVKKGIDVVVLSELAGVPDAHRHQLLEVDPTAFSGVSVISGDSKLIVVNDGHTPERQVNTVAHEIAHFLLKHAPGPAFGDFGRMLSKTIEQEADWLAGCLLVPGSGIRATMQMCAGDLDAAAEHYGVSVQLMRWRRNVTNWRRQKKAA